MALVSKTLRSVEGDGLSFRCPGCKTGHVVWVGEGHAPRWGYNCNPDKPTFTPSLLLSSHRWTPEVTTENLDQWKRQPWEQVKVPFVCHSFITDGRIQFLGDCTHELAGQTVDLPEWPQP